LLALLALLSMLRHLALVFVLALLQQRLSLSPGLARRFEARHFCSRGPRNTPRKQWHMARHRRSKHHHLAVSCRPRSLRLARRHLRRLALALLCLSKPLLALLSLPLRPCLPQRPLQAGLRDGRAGTGSLAGRRDGTGSLAGSRNGTGSTSRAGRRDLPLSLRNSLALSLRNLSLRNSLALSLRILFSSFRSTAW
jgi:hypothetical protein